MLQPQVNVVILTIPHAEPSLWFLWRHTDGLYWIVNFDYCVMFRKKLENLVSCTCFGRNTDYWSAANSCTSWYTECVFCRIRKTCECYYVICCYLIFNYISWASSPLEGICITCNVAIPFFAYWLIPCKCHVVIGWFFHIYVCGRTTGCWKIYKTAV